MVSASFGVTSLALGGLCALVSIRAHLGYMVARRRGQRINRRAVSSYLVRESASAMGPSGAPEAILILTVLWGVSPSKTAGITRREMQRQGRS